MRNPRISTLIPVLCLASSWFSGCKAEPDDVLPPPPKAVAPKKVAPAPPCNAGSDPLLTETFKDDFDRTELGNDWATSSYGAYAIRGGRVCTQKPRNHPLWLKKRLPANVRVELEATAYSPDGDVKVELFGDGCSFDTEGKGYMATSYVAVLGAHKNTEHWLARMDEHGIGAKKTPLLAGTGSIQNGKLVQNQTYKLELSRTDGRTFSFKVDGVLVHEMADDKPLAGAGHDHFSLNGWEATVCFDKVTITPL